MVRLTGQIGDGNRLLAGLSEADRARLGPLLKPVELPLRHCREMPNRRVRTVYFLERGLASVVCIAAGAGGRQAEVALIGREGMTGLPVLFGGDRSPHQTFMQIEGSGVAIGAGDLQRLLATRSSMATHLLRFAQVFAVQLAQTALANTKGKLEERLARWLLMAHDRLGGDAVHLTHESLALMLGTRRAGVTTALNNFEAKMLIASARGRISIRDRAGLMSIAGGLYRVPEREFEELFPSV